MILLSRFARRGKAIGYRQASARRFTVEAGKIMTGLLHHLYHLIKRDAVAAISGTGVACAA